MYPEYALGLRSPEGMTNDQVHTVANSLTVLKRQFGSARPIKYKNRDKTIFMISNDADAQAYVVSDQITDQVLFLTFHKMDAQRVQAILGGIQ
jgi:hypothetical protein